MAFQLLRLLTNLLEISWQASASLPIIIALGLAAGRRGNARFLGRGNLKLLNFEICCAIFGVLYFLLAYFCLILPYHNENMSIWKPFLEAAGLPWSSAMLMQATAVMILLAARESLRDALPTKDKYPLAAIKKPLLLCLAASLCFLATFFLINWPFAGIPAGMDMDRAFFAVLRNAFRHFYMSFCPAGGLALVYVIWSRREMEPKDLLLAARWLSIWAFIGYLPYLLQAWAILLGLGWRGNAASYFPGGFMTHVWSIALLSAALCFWCVQALSRKVLPILVLLAFGLFLARLFLPFFLQNAIA